MAGFRLGLGGSAAAAALLVFTAPAAAQVQEQTYTFNIPAQALGSALRAFGQASNQQIIFSEDAVRGKRSPALVGSYIVSDGLQRLLAGSDLTINRTSSGVISVGSSVGRGDETKAAASLSELVVTGSRIRRTNTSTATPLTVVTADELTERGFTQVGEMLNQVTSNVPEVPEAFASGFPAGSGQTFPNLFNLGEGRTLTLVNGRRMVTSASGLGERAVDVNVIPAGLVDRIDIVEAGGASVYGSDAIAGVVNYVLKKNFHGLELDAQYGEGPGGHYRQPSIRVTWGENFADGRANLAADFEYSSTTPLLEEDRPFTASSRRSIPNPAYTGPGHGIPPTIYVYNGRAWSYNENGVIFARNSRSPGALLLDPNGNPLQFSADGASIIPYDTGAIQDHTTTAIGGQGYDFRKFSTLLAGVRRYSAAVIGHYDFTPHVTLSGEFIAGREEGSDPLGTEGGFQTVGGFIPAGFGPITFDKTNAFLSPSEIATLSAASPSFAAGGPLVLSKVLNTLPTREATSVTDTWRALAALNGDFRAVDRDFYWTISASRGQTNAQQSVWAVYTDRFNNAVNAVRNAAGQIVCANGDPACVPIDIFGHNSVSAAAQAYSSVLTGNNVHNTQDDLLATLGGDVIALPAGKVKFSVAYEHRSERASFIPSQADQLGLTFGGSVTPPESGAYHTNEFSGELLVPLVGGDFTLPFVKALELDGSYRFIDNSLAGREKVWGAGVRWEVAYGLTLRASRSRNFSAPTLDEQFAPTTFSSEPANDPCDLTQITSGPNPSARLANCQALFAAHPGYGPLATFQDPSQNTGTVFVTNGGNPNLKNEISNTTTFGFVFRPDYIPGLTISADRINIDLTNGLSSFEPNDFLAVCFDTSPQPAGICGTFTRDAQGFLATAHRTTFNAGSVIFRGEVYNFDYAFPIDRFIHGRNLGDLEFGVDATHTARLETSVTGFDHSRSEGTVQTPDWRARFDLRYSRGPLRLFYSLYYLPAVKSSYYATIETTPVPIVSANYQHSVSVQYDFGRYTVRAGVNNLTDEQPSFPTRTYGDILGRRYYVGLRARF